MTGTPLTYADPGLDSGAHAGYEKALGELAGEPGRSFAMMIDGKEVSGKTEFEVRSPFDTRILLGRFPVAGPAQVRDAIAASKAGFPGWRDRDWRERAGIIRTAADRLGTGRFSLAALITYECGKTRAEALAEVGEAIAMLRYHAEVYEKAEGYVSAARPEHPGDTCRSVMRPYGAWPVISPFNFPLVLAAGMAGAALITGNTVVLKPTSFAPCSALKLYEAFTGAGVPADAIQFVTGPGEMFGEAVTAHPDVAGIAFTGSRAAGTWLSRTFAARQRYQKPVVMEMGSKNPVIVTAHADLEKAVEGTARSAFGYGGQKCSAASRVYVHESVAEAFIAALRTRTEGLVTGDPRERETFTGPLISADAVRKFRDAVGMARKDGGRVVCGGTVPEGPGFSHGHWALPTIVTGLTRGHPLARTELFVPLLVVDTFSTMDEALAEANATDYGLTAGMYSEDEAELRTFFAEIQSGVTYANRRGGATTGAWPGTQAFCGWKASGSTGRGVGGSYYLLSYLREQAQMRVR
jgi:1-pyrroline-5-carboxylate dehydrogenase